MPKRALIRSVRPTGGVKTQRWESECGAEDLRERSCFDWCRTSEIEAYSAKRQPTEAAPSSHSRKASNSPRTDLITNPMTTASSIKPATGMTSGIRSTGETT